MRIVKVVDVLEARRTAEQHDVTHRRADEVDRLKAVLEIAYPDKQRFAIEDTIAYAHRNSA